MLKPLVSIIIPVYNAQKYLAGAIKSAIGQTWSNKEIIIVDDGSTDDSFAIAKKFEAPDVVIIQQENKGASAARNRGLRASKGEYVQFLDSDDLLSENKIERQLIQLVNKPAHLGICDTVYFKDDQNPFESKPTVAWYSQSFDSNIDFLINLYGGEFVGPNLGGMVQPNCWLTPRKILDKAGEWNEDLSVDDDGEYFCRVLLKAEGICYSSEALNYYRQNTNGKNLSAQHNHRGLISMLKSTELKEKHLSNIIKNDLLKKAFSLLYQEISILSYPKFIDISNYSLQKAKMLGLKKITYKGGPVTSFLSKIFGWKLIKTLNYLRFSLSK